MSLADYKFGDIYLGEKKRFLDGLRDVADPSIIPDDCIAELDELLLACQAHDLKRRVSDGFTVSCAGTLYRVSVMNSLFQKTYILRRFPPSVPALDKLRIHGALVDLLMRPGLTGLVLFSGSYGQGKTTTASATVAARLKKHGGVAVTIEDPPEMPLEGPHGTGYCYQTEVGKGGFGDRCREAARWPNEIIFMGEIRDSEAAVEALRASINGRLVLATTHADSVPLTITRMYHLASGAAQGDDAASMVADALTGIFHQRLHDDNGSGKRLQMSFLWLGGGDPFAKGVRSLIRNKKFHGVETEVQHQANRLNMNLPLESPPGD
jgi:twitching motility protein PilT